MNTFVRSPQTDKSIQAYLESPSHALGIVGQGGAGKGTAARYIASNLLTMASERLDSYAYFRLVQPTKGVISIETARAIIEFMKLKTTGEQPIRRIVIIEDAQALTVEAQNALLKVIEEPPTDTVLILTARSASSMLPTILSRLQLLPLAPPDEATLADYFSEAGYAKSAIQKYYLMSGGMPGLLQALLDSNESHPMLQAIELAKMVLRADSFERLTMIDDIVKQKQTENLLLALEQTARTALLAAAQKSNDAALRRWSDILQITYRAKELLGMNGQPKLVLTDLFLHI